MAAGDQMRRTAQQAIDNAKNKRSEADAMRRQVDQLEQDAKQLEAEASTMNRQAQDADAAEQRANNAAS